MNNNVTLSQKISNDYREYIQLKSKKGLTENDTKRLQEISSYNSQLLQQPTTLKKLDGVSISKIAYTVDNSSDTINNLFSFTPPLNSLPLSTSLKFAPVNNDTVVKYGGNIANGRVLGNNKKQLGVPDDVLYYGSPTLDIHQQSGTDLDGYIHEIPNNTNITEYKISFDFKLNRFPSKTYRNPDYMDFIKQLTCRNTDLISFNYDGTKNWNNDGNLLENKIEFGAMAPKSRYKVGLTDSEEKEKDKEKTIIGFKNQYSPFSIAASISTNNNRKTSFYTDYKFELGKWYNVTLIISEAISITRENTNCRIQMLVNGIQEDIAVYNGKAWGKNRGKGATQPGFLSFNSNPANKEKNRKIESALTQNITVVHGLNFNKLLSINTCPSKIQFLSDTGVYAPFYQTDTVIRKKINKAYLYKTNNGVDFGSIHIYNKQ